MYEPAYIALGPDGHVTLFWGDGTEAHKDVIKRGPRPASSQDLIDIIEDLKAWAEDNGFTVVVPSYDLEVPDIEIDLPPEDAEHLTLDDVDDLIEDLLMAEDYAEDFGEDEDTNGSAFFDTGDEDWDDTGK